MKLGVLGGTFDPIHLGHMAAADAARAAVSLDRVLFVPAGDPYLKAGTAISPGEDRLAMVPRRHRGPRGLRGLHDGARPPRPHLHRGDAGGAAGGPRSRTRSCTSSSALTPSTTSRAGTPRPRCSRAAPSSSWGAPAQGDLDLEMLDAIAPGSTARAVAVDLDVEVSATEIPPPGWSGRVAGGPRPPGRRALHKGTPTVQGARMSTERRQRVLELAKELGALTFGDFILTSGQHSSYYFDGPPPVARRRRRRAPRRGVSSTLPRPPAPPPSAASPSAPTPSSPASPSRATTLAPPSRAFHRPQGGQDARRRPPHRGAPLASGASVVIVDDACSTGGSLFQAIAAAESRGLHRRPRRHRHRPPPGRQRRDPPPRLPLHRPPRVQRRRPSPRRRGLGGAGPATPLHVIPAKAGIQRGEGRGRPTLPNAN